MEVYVAPELDITTLESSDVITASKGDSPFDDYEW